MPRVLIVDDSPVVRRLLSLLLNAYRELEVEACPPLLSSLEWRVVRSGVSAAIVDGKLARRVDFSECLDYLGHHDVHTIFTDDLFRRALQQHMRRNPTGGESLGALAPDLKLLLEKLRVRVITATAKATVKPAPRREPIIDPAALLESPGTPTMLIDDYMTLTPPPRAGEGTLIAIGASTGGTIVVEDVLKALPGNMPPIVIAQHMPGGFTARFAERLNEHCELTVQEARDGMELTTGMALIAPGGKHLVVKRGGEGYRAFIEGGGRVNRHRPSVDVLFRSVANAAGKSAIAAILTGMGDDGARGMKDLFDCGAMTIAQDEASCVVFGMPRVAIELGGIRRVLPADRIAGQLCTLAGLGPSYARAESLAARNAPTPRFGDTLGSRRAVRQPTGRAPARTGSRHGTRTIDMGTLPTLRDPRK